MVILLLNVNVRVTIIKMLEGIAKYVIILVLNVWIIKQITVIHATVLLLELLSMGFLVNANAWLGITRILTEIASPATQRAQLALVDQQLNVLLAAQHSSESQTQL